MKLNFFRILDTKILALWRGKVAPKRQSATHFQFSVFNFHNYLAFLFNEINSIIRADTCLYLLIFSEILTGKRARCDVTKSSIRRHTCNFRHDIFQRPSWNQFRFEASRTERNPSRDLIDGIWKQEKKIKQKIKQRKKLLDALWRHRQRQRVEIPPPAAGRSRPPARAARRSPRPASRW